MKAVLNGFLVMTFLVADTASFATWWWPDIPFIDCAGTSCVWQLIRARFQTRLRITTIETADRISGRFAEKNRLLQANHDLKMQLSKDKLERDLALMELEEELLSSTIRREDRQHREWLKSF